MESIFISIITGSILTVIILFSLLAQKSKEVKKWKENWQFCRNLLEEHRDCLSEDQLAKMNEKMIQRKESKI